MNAIEKLGIPTVLMTADRFVNTAKVDARIQKMPLPRLAIFPYTGEVILPPAEGRKLSEGMIDAIEAGLTRPLTPEESSPAFSAQKSERVIFEGTEDGINNFFYKTRLTDGLPIVCPSEEKVAWMLTGTDLPKDTVVAEMPPTFGVTTVEKIAINAAMAGCRPEYMPVLIAAAEAIADKAYNLYTSQQSTSGLSPFLVINGPIAKELDINAKYQVLGPGWQANATIGRAIRLIINNCGGVWPGMNDMATMGTPARYTSMVIAENEEALPPGWEPLSVQGGHGRDANTVTALTMMSIACASVCGTPEQNIAYLSELMAPMYIPGVWGFAPYIALIGPAFAQNLYGAGFTSKESVSDWLFKHTGRPLRVLQERCINIKHAVDMGRLPAWVLSATDPDTFVPFVARPQDFIVVVAGGEGSHAYSIQGGHAKRVTGLIDKYRPANWEKLMGKRREEVGRAPIAPTTTKGCI